ncbi:hypothetical protein ACRAWD_07010 [Caulobacter segnis]
MEQAGFRPDQKQAFGARPRRLEGLPGQAGNPAGRRRPNQGGLIVMSTLMRQVHRWLSIAFTAGVLTYIAVMTRGQPPWWVGLFALAPLILLLATGLYLFALPYAVEAGGGPKA